MLQDLVDQLFVLLQRALPARLIGRGVHALCRSRRPWLRTTLIRLFVRRYRVDLGELDHPEPEAYPTVNAFFTRALRPGARPVDPAPLAFVSPADGTVETIDYVRHGMLIQAKKFPYRLSALLACDDAEARAFEGGALLTVYLAPHNYHRVHLPYGARVNSVTHVAGRRWAVNARTARTLPGLFAANERVVCWCESPAGRYALVLVGAMNVASISLAWMGEIEGGRSGVRRWDFAGDEAVELPTGGLLGQFNLGSTVIVVAERDLVRWDLGADATREVRMGQRLGWVAPAPGRAR